MRSAPIVGLDLSLTATGRAAYCPQRNEFVCSTVGSKGKRSDTYAMRGARLADLKDRIVQWSISVGLYHPELVVIEGPSIGSVNGSQHDRSGLWWMVVSDFQARDIPVLVVPPKTRAKYATGNGNSGKDVVLAHVIERYADNTKDRIKNDNEADAIVLAAMGARFLGIPQEATPPPGMGAMSGVHVL